MKISKKQTLITGFLVLGFLIATPVSVKAIESNTETANEPNTAANSLEGRRALESARTDRQAARDNLKTTEQAHKEAKVKLADTKLKVCKLRQQHITDIMNRSGDRATKQLTVFSQISERVQTFYVDKGINVSNYEDLLASINNAKLDAESAIEKTKSLVPDFQCDGTDPKGAAATFQAAVKEHNASLKVYKTSIRNLIVAVKTANAASEESSTEVQQ